MTPPRFFATHEELEAAAQGAEDAWRAGRWREALGAFCDMFLKRWSDLAGTPGVLTPADLIILERITDFAVPFGLAHEADMLLLHITRQYEHLGNRLWADRIAVKRVHLALNDFNPTLAYDRLKALCSADDLRMDSVQTWEDTYRVANRLAEAQELFAGVWLELGRLQHLQGQNRPAVLCFVRGLDRSPISRGARLSLQLAVVRCLIELGDLRAAEQRLDRIRHTLDVRQYPAYTTAWHELSAKLHLLCGDLGAARRNLREVWRVCCRFRFVGPILRATTNFAQMLILMNQTIEAQQLLERVIAAAALRGDERLATHARRLRQVAAVRFGHSLSRPRAVKDDQTSSTAAELPPEELFATTASSCYTLADFEERALHVQWCLRRRDWPAARKALDRLYPFSHTDSVIIALRLDIIGAMLEYYDGDRTAARDRLSRLCEQLRGLGLKSEHWQVQVLLARCLDGGEEQQRLRKDNDRLLDELGSSLPVRAQVIYLLDKATELDESLAIRVHRLQDLEDEKQKAGLWRRAALRLKTWSAINELLDAAYWQRERHNARLLDAPESDARQRSPTPLWRRLFVHSFREATVAFLVFPDSTVIVCRHWLSLTFRVSPLGRYALRQEVAKWHQQVPRADFETRDAALNSLRKALGLDTVADRMPWYIRRVRILPDDALHGLPFSAIELPQKDRGKIYWSDRFTLSIAFQPESRVTPRVTQPRPLVAGVSRGSAQSRPLLKTPEQLEWVGRWLEGRGYPPVVLQESAATVDALCEQLRTSTILHASCHGEFVQGHPDRTGLLLAGVDGERVLSLPRLSSLDLAHLQHATLIACWAADNFVLPGRWILSLPEALWRAGTGSILASLWEVEEDVADRFVHAFYSNLFGRSADEALRKAQAQMRAARGKDRDAKNWAGFQVYGNAGRLNL